ncbi:MAG: DUF1015 domain-containing protein [Candidatus Thorarchaeota archaeon SMTZ1-45]|nr:MAG: hypothetical protein AM325_10500 [Candidatus Thorarchaeota archaeon SMTZ1-45]
MVRVKPFRAYRYNEAKAGSLSRLVTPPYDIIKGAMIDKYQSLSEYNMAWIIKNKAQENDTPQSNQYTRARDHLKKWIDEEILIRDDKESFYVYGQDFEIDGKKLFRFGFIGLIELEEFATVAPNTEKFVGVLQHEETLPKDIEDRLNLCRSCMANFGQIFVIYPDSKREVDSTLERHMERDPIGDVIDGDGIRHRLWRIDDDDDVNRIVKLMEDKYIIIADGHHRYKTALALSIEHQDLESAQFRMLTFVNISNPGLVVLPTHRLVQNLDDFSSNRLLKDISKYFDVETFQKTKDMFELMNKKFQEGKHSFGLFVNDGKFYVLTLNDLSMMDELLPDKSEKLRGLDVVILHALILDKMLGIDKQKLEQGTMKGGGYVSYIKGIGDAVEESIKTVQEDGQAVFFMNPTRVNEVEAVSKNFECMPQKSTFFQPKVWTGFTINKLE